MPPESTSVRPAVSVSAPGRPRRFYPQLEGMRAVAALGVLTTHVAFQTGAERLPVLGPVLGRLDLAVALFFALSGFLLWRSWVAAAHQDPARASAPPVRRYLCHRVVRIWPAYVVVVVLVLTLLPEARAGADLTVWLANLTLTQVFVPLSLTAGLTQMWSLSVEVAFYLILPVFGYALFRLRDERVGLRIPVLLGIGVVSLGWAWVAGTLPVPDGVQPTNWVFGYLPWFVVGLLLAEITGEEPGWEGREARAVRVVAAIGARRRLMFVVLVIAYGLACTRLAGPTGLGDLAPWQFAVKVVLGAVCAFALLAPLIASDGPFRILDSAPMLALGRWSYGIFIWHVAVLAVVFGLFGIVPFSGHTVLVWLITVALTVGLSAASYAFVEEPARQWLRRRETTPSPKNAHQQPHARISQP
ncbi:acyltransferase family protein [Gordonia sp. NPDC003429]